MKRLTFATIIIAMLLARASFAGDYLTDIRDYLVNTIQSQKISYTQFLTFTKPYGKWDTRSSTNVSINGDVTNSKEVPNYLWGYIGTDVFELSIKDLQRYPEDFLRDPQFNKALYISNAQKNKQQLLDLITRIKESKRSIFVQQFMLKQNSYCRIDDIFREGDKYWRYNISADSPFQMSPHVEVIKSVQFALVDEIILKQLELLRLYCGVKVNTNIVLMIGGMLDNSFGYIWAEQKPTPETLGPLFHLRELESIGDNLYFYISN